MMNKFIWSSLFMALGIAALGQGPPITTGTPVMLGLEGSGIRTFGKIIYKEHSRIYVQPIGIPYNISPKFQVGGTVPIKSIKTEDDGNNVGLSDLTFFSKYQLYKKDGKAKTFRILAHFRQSFPTGNTQNTPTIGGGIYQTYLGLILGRISSAVGVYGDFGYNIRGQGAPDNFSYNFSVGIPLLPQKYPQKQINTFLEFNGNYVLDIAVHSLFVSPGIQFIPGKRFLLESSLQLPIVQQNSGTQPTRYMFLLGTRFLIK